MNNVLCGVAVVVVMFTTGAQAMHIKIIKSAAAASAASAAVAGTAGGVKYKTQKQQIERARALKQVRTDAANLNVAKPSEK